MPDTRLYNTLLQMPLWRGLEESVVRELLAATRHYQLAVGDQLISAGQPGAPLFCLVRGEVVGMAQGHAVTLVTGPALLGLLQVCEGAASELTLRANSAADVFALPWPAFEQLLAISPVLRKNLLGMLASEIQALRNQTQRSTAAFDAYLASPHARVLPGPYVVGPHEMYVFVLRSDPARLRGLLPPGIRPLPWVADCYLLVLSFFERMFSLAPPGGHAELAYNECSWFIPCVGPGLRTGVFCPELYADNHLAIMVGREVFGFPKRYGEVQQIGRSIRLATGGRVVLHAGWDAEQPLDSVAFVAGLAGMLWERPLATSLLWALRRLRRLRHTTDRSRQLSLFTRRQIADPLGKRSDVQSDTLMQIPCAVTSLGAITALPGAAVHFPDQQWSIQGGPPQGECAGAFRVRIGYSFGAARRRRKYACLSAGRGR